MIFLVYSNFSLCQSFLRKEVSLFIKNQFLRLADNFHAGDLLYFFHEIFGNPDGIHGQGTSNANHGDVLGIHPRHHFNGGLNGLLMPLKKHGQLAKTGDRAGQGIGIGIFRADFINHPFGTGIRH